MPTIANSARKDVAVIWICHRRDTGEGASTVTVDLSAVWTGTLRAVIVDCRVRAGCVSAGCSPGIASVGGGSTARPPTACVGNGADSKAPSSKQKDSDESEYVRLHVGHCFMVSINGVTAVDQDSWKRLRIHLQVLFGRSAYECARLSRASTNSQVWESCDFLACSSHT